MLTTQGEDGSDDLYQPNDAYALAGEQYEFSTDVEVHSLEKKMRSVGHTLAKKGVDVEQMFKVHYTVHVLCYILCMYCVIYIILYTVFALVDV